MRPPAQPNQSLIDGLAVLQGVVGRGTPIGSRELARELDLEPTRVNRLLKTLAHLGLTQQGDDRKYRPGAAVHVLAAQALFGSHLLRRAVPHLERLQRYGMIVAMGVLWRDRVSYLYHAEPGMNAAQALGRAGLHPAERSGIGVALWASDADLRRVPAAARDLVREARDRGYALVPTGGGSTQSLGVALPDDSGTAIALSGPVARDQIGALVAALHDAAQAIIADNLVTGDRP